MQIGFAENNGSRFFQLGDDSSVESQEPNCSSTFDPAVVLTPWVAMSSLMENGIPWSAPR